MKRNPRRLIGMLALFALVLVVYAVLLTVASDYVNKSIIQPIFFLLWAIRMVINSFPQSVYLICLLGIGIFLALVGLSRFNSPEVKLQREGYPASETRYQSWLLYTRRMGISRYAREIFGRDLNNLLLRVLIHQENINLSEAEALTASENLPPEIGALIRERVLPPPARPEALWTRLLRRLRWRAKNKNSTPATLEHSVDQVLTFLEQRLEIDDQDVSMSPDKRQPH